MAERFYVWVYTPSAVRSNYLVGVSDGAWSRTREMNSYDEDAAVRFVQDAVTGRDAIFHSADEFDAPVSAALCARLKQSAPPPQAGEE